MLRNRDPAVRARGAALHARPAPGRREPRDRAARTCASRSSSSTACSTWLAYNPGGAEGLTRRRDEGPPRATRASCSGSAGSAQNTDSLFATADAQGPFRRFISSATCTALSEPASNERAGASSRSSASPTLLNDPGLCPLEVIKDKQAPTLGRLVAMVAFALSCFGVLLYMWLRSAAPCRSSRGLPVQGAVPGVGAARDRGRRAHRRAQRGQGEEEGARPKRRRPDGRDRDRGRKYAPLPSDTRAILRPKSLLGQTYIELTPGLARRGADARRRARSSRARRSRSPSRSTSSSRPSTRTRARNFQGWMRELARRSTRAAART